MKILETIGKIIGWTIMFVIGFYVACLVSESVEDKNDGQNHIQEIHSSDLR